MEGEGSRSETEGSQSVFSSKCVAVALVALSAFAFSIMSLLVNKISYEAGGDEVFEAIVLLRFGIPWLAVSIILVIAGENPWSHFADRSVLTRSLINVSAAALEALTLQQLTLVDATIIMFTHPFYAAVLSVFLLGEVWSLLKSGLLILAFAGVVLICNPWDTETTRSPWTRLPGVAFGVAYSINVAGLNVWTRMKTSGTNAFLLIHHYLALGTLVLVCKLAVNHGTDSLRLLLTALATCWADILVLCSSVVVGEVACTKGFQTSDVGILSSVRNIDIVLVFIWQTLFLMQPPDAWKIAGAVCVATATLLLVVPWLLLPSKSEAKTASADREPYEQLIKQLECADTKLQTIATPDSVAVPHLGL